MIKKNISKRLVSLIMAVLLALPFSALDVFADGIGDGKSSIYVGMIDVSSYAHGAVSSLMDGSKIIAGDGSGMLKYYRKSDGNLAPLYCVEPGTSLYTGNNLDLNSYIRNKTNKTLTEKEDISAMLGRLFLFAYTGEATDLAEPMAQYFASQLLVWEIVVGERDMFFNHVSNSNGGDVCDLLNSMNSTVAERVKGYYNSYVSQMKNHMKIPSFCSLRSDAAEIHTVDASGKVTLTDSNNVLSNFKFSSSAGAVSVSGSKLTVTVPAGQTATVTASKSVNTEKRAMFCYGASGLQSVVSVGELEADPRSAFVKVKGLEKGTLHIVKTSEDGIVANIAFTVTGNGKTYNVKTGTNGEISIPDLSPGTYTVTETVPVRYESQQSKTVTVQAGKTASVSFANTLKKGAIKINKQAEDGEIGGRSFTISGNGKTYTISTNSDGVATLFDIPVYNSSNSKITYTISEKNIPVKYVVPASQAATLTADATVTKTFKNVLKKFTVEVTKKDAESGSAQGNGTLAGAIYGLYQDGELIDSYTTDENGSFTTKEYVCGSYTMKEISQSEGYLLDTAEYAVGSEAKNYTIEHNSLSLTVKETAVKGYISIIKHSDDGTTQIETPEAGAEFQVYLKSSGSYDKSAETERDTLICDENGYAKSKALPYGVYIVNQTKGWENTEWMSDFEVSITENSKTYQYLINDAVKKSLVKIVKKDAETGKTIAVSGIGFKLWDTKNKKYVSQTVNYPSQAVMDTFYTDSTGTLMLPQELVYGSYELVEVQTAQGYYLGNEKVPFTIDGKEKVITVEKFNTAQKGKISVQKTGDVFSSVAVASSAYLDENGNEVVNPTTYTPVFKEQNLSGAVFQITVAEDIVTADGTVRAKKGDVVSKITTDKNGYAQTELLYLGKYEIREIKAPDGYVLDSNPQAVELTYAGQEVKVGDTVKANFFDDYQGIAISLAKTLEQDEAFRIGYGTEYQNVRFGIFADEEITAADGTFIPKDGLIAEVSLSENMTASFDVPLPFGKYYVQEISTDEHYILNGEKFLVNFKYQGQDMKTVNIDCGAFINTLKRGSINGLKVDEETKSPLEGAVFGLFKLDASENSNENAYSAEKAVLTAVSDESGCFSFTGIPYGDYVVKELEAPEGYVLSETLYPVTVSEDGQLIEITAENTKIRGSVTVTKFDAEYPDNKLSGAVFTVYSDEACTVEIGTLGETDTGVYVLENLAYGQYYLRETLAPEGFLLDSEVYPFTITESGEITEVSNLDAGHGFADAPLTGSVQITKTDISDGRPIPDCGIEILDKDDKVIVQGRTDENGVVTFEKLRYGKYFYREFDAPEGYILDEKLYPFAIRENGEIVKCSMTNEKIPETPKTPEVPKIPDSPKTGVDYPVPKALAVACMAAAVGIAAAKKKRKKDDSDEN